MCMECCLRFRCEPSTCTLANRIPGGRETYHPHKLSTNILALTSSSRSIILSLDNHFPASTYNCVHVECRADHRPFALATAYLQPSTAGSSILISAGRTACCKASLRTDKNQNASTSGETVKSAHLPEGENETDGIFSVRLAVNQDHWSHIGPAPPQPLHAWTLKSAQGNSSLFHVQHRLQGHPRSSAAGCCQTSRGVQGHESSVNSDCQCLVGPISRV